MQVAFHLLRYIVPFIAPFLLLGLPDTPFTLAKVMERSSALLILAASWAVFVYLAVNFAAIKAAAQARSRVLSVAFLVGVGLTVLINLGLIHTIRSKVNAGEFVVLLAILGLIGFTAAARRANKPSYLISTLRLLWEAGAVLLAFKFYMLAWRWQAVLFALPWIFFSLAWEQLSAKAGIQPNRHQRLAIAFALLLAPFGPLFLFYLGQLPHIYGFSALLYLAIWGPVSRLVDNSAKSVDVAKELKLVQVAYFFATALAVLPSVLP